MYVEGLVEGIQVDLFHGAFAIVPRARAVGATVSAYRTPHVAFHAGTPPGLAGPLLMSAPATAVLRACVAVTGPGAQVAILKALEREGDRSAAHPVAVAHLEQGPHTRAPCIVSPAAAPLEQYAATTCGRASMHSRKHARSTPAAASCWRDALKAYCCVKHITSIDGQPAR